MSRRLPRPPLANHVGLASVGLPCEASAMEEWDQEAMRYAGVPMAERNDSALKSVRALTFDVQGTCADFARPILRMGQAVNRAKNLEIDWAALSAEWRGLYRTVLDDIIAGRRTWIRVDRIYRETLDTLLERRGLSGTFSPAERDELNKVWSRLEAWPDSVEGLGRLRRRFVTSTLSNAAMPTMVAVVKHAGLPFDAVLTAELAH